MNRIVSGMKVAVTAKAGKASATITNRGVIITRFETEDRGGLVRRLDRQMKDYGFYRTTGYVSEGGLLVADCSRAVTA
jgi:hypothetical protein